MKEKSTPSEQSSVPELSSARMQVSYANFCRGTMTAEEIVLDFGFNPNFPGSASGEPAELSSRVVLSVPSAVRLHQLLQTLLVRRQEAVRQQQEGVPPAGPGESAVAPQGAPNPPA